MLLCNKILSILIDLHFPFRVNVIGRLKFCNVRCLKDGTVRICLPDGDKSKLPIDLSKQFVGNDLIIYTMMCRFKRFIATYKIENIVFNLETMHFFFAYHLSENVFWKAVIEKDAHSINYLKHCIEPKVWRAV